jgi:hypothetical protein
MDKIAAYEKILAEHPLWEKTAVTEMGALILAGLGAATALGAAAGGAAGAMTTHEGNRLRGAGVGAMAGGIGGLLMASPVGSPVAGGVAGGLAAHYLAGPGATKEAKLLR